MDTADLRNKNLDELKSLAKDKRIKGYSKLKKSDILVKLATADTISDNATCDSSVCKLDAKRSTKIDDHVDHDHVDRSSARSIDDEEKLKDYMKKISKPKLLQHAAKFDDIANPGKLAKKDLLDLILERTVALKLEELSA